MKIETFKQINVNNQILITEKPSFSRSTSYFLSCTKKKKKKYKDYPKISNKDILLPVLTNQKMNSYLKELGDICGINKGITIHVARHTFATTVTLSNGVPIETVSKLLGHSSLKTTQIYVKVLDKKNITGHGSVGGKIMQRRKH